MASALAVGCGPEDPAGDGDGTGSTSEAAGTTAVVDSTTGEATTGGPWEAPLARGGISLDWVQANQGVGVTIGADGGEVGGGDRAAALIQDRVTLIRAFWTVPDDWETREIEGRLTVVWPDDSEEVFRDTKIVEGDAFEGDPERYFFWGLMAEQVVPGIRYRVELFETSPDYDALPESAAPRLPADGGLAYVGIEDSYLVMKTVVVPFIYDDGAGCSTVPDTSEETMQLFQDLMYMQNPIDRLDFEVHEPIMWDTPLTSFFQLNSFMAGLRADEGALPETYYFGLVDVCSGGLGGAGGQAIDIPSDPVNPNAASSRISSGLSLDPDWSAETFVHEVGHCQGRRHVACNGEEGGPDPSYPYDGGDVGEWGFGVIDFGMRHPTFYKDYMTYCHPTWVGTWGWNKVYPVIRGLSEWDDGFPGGAVAPPDGGTTQAPPVDPYTGSLLMGMITPDGEEYWVTVPGNIDGRPRGSMRIELRAGGRLVADELAYVHEVADGEGTVVMVSLPERWSEVTGITRVTGDVRTPVARSAVDEHHRNRLVRRRAP
ncbi:MAG: hypothetical protein H6712_34970 [Myxococcales bacterium]|nr:hypothetical protein [Myxococcales bacterium]MCB9719101.1 hypothetical protein [Myxococcales bacterium]